MFLVGLMLISCGRKDPPYGIVLTHEIGLPTPSTIEIVLGIATCASNTRGLFGTDLINLFLRICNYQKSRTSLNFKIKTAVSRQVEPNND